MKKPRHTAKRRRTKRSRLDPFDQAGICCSNVSTLAALLEVCGETTPFVTLAPRFLQHAGAMLSADVARLEQLLDEIKNDFARCRRKI